MYKADLANTKLRTLPRLLQLQAQHNGDTVFLIDDQQSLTFSETQQRCLALATGFAELGIGKGDRVALYLSNCPEMVLVALAVNMLQAIWVPISTDYHGDWLADSVRRSRAKLLVTESALQQRMTDIEKSAGIEQLMVIDAAADDPRLDFNQLLQQPAYQPDYAAMHYGDTCSIVWTSGTTGRSKGVMVSHNGWLRPIHQGTSVFYESLPGDVIFNVLPMYHAGAWNTSVLRALAEGITVVLEKHFSVQNFWQRIRKFGATQSFTLGALHIFLWKAPPGKYDQANPLRVLQAVPMPQELVKPFEQRFGLTLVGAGFGQSECMMITTEAGATEPLPENSIGFAKSDTLVRIFDDNDQKLAVGEVGEIRVKPLQPYIICNGYFDMPEATRAAWKDGWFCTGDLGWFDENGAFFFSDRKKDAVRFAGRNISTMEVESVVRQHPDVAEVAAYGIPSTELEAEDELKIDLVLTPGAAVTHAEIAKFINDRAPYYFVPRYMDFVASLPYTPTNKIQKYILREAGIGADTWDLKSSRYKVKK